jgi:hypothetical protein
MAGWRFVRRSLVTAVLLYAGTVLTIGGSSTAPRVFQLACLAALIPILLTAWFSPRHAAARTLELLLTNLACCLLLGELALRGVLAWQGGSVLVSQALDENRLRPGHDYGSGLRGNRLGYPGRDFVRERRPGVRRIAALGDSFAVGPAVPFADNYLTVLEGSLDGVEVYNFGVSGAGPREYRTILEKDVWVHQPDLVLLSLFVGNDITEELATPRHLDPRQHALYLLCERGYRLLRERLRRPIESDSPTVRVTAPALSPQTFREVEARRLAVCVTPVEPAMEKKWQRALGHLDALVRSCQGRSVPLAVVLIPDEFQVNPAVLAEAVAEAGLEPERVDLDMPQRRLHAFFAERGVPCLDLLPAFSGVPDAYALRDTHWNARGNRLAAGRIREWVVPLLPSRSRALIEGRPPSGGTPPD